MSLASWKREFYRISANEVSERHALKHSLRKWTGLLYRNKKKHKVSLEGKNLVDDEDHCGQSHFAFDSDSCALCKHHMEPSSICSNCPLRNCNKQYGYLMKGRVVPMINLLKKALKG